MNSNAGNGKAMNNGGAGATVVVDEPQDFEIKIAPTESELAEEAGMTTAEYRATKTLNKFAESEVREDPTDVQSFSIIMNSIDQSIIDYIAKLFKGKKVSVAIDVKEVM